MKIMGWTVVEPLSPGVFQIDPSVYGAESNRVFNVPIAGKVTAEIVEELSEKLSKEIAEEVSEEISEQIGKQVSEEVSEQATREVMAQAYKNVQDAAEKRTGRKLAGAALDSAVKKEARQLATEKVAKEFGETIVEKGGKEVVEETGEKMSREMAEASVEETLEKGGKGLSQTQKDILKFTQKSGMGILIIGGGLFIANNFIGTIGSAIGGAAGDWAATFTGQNCREQVEESWPDNPELWGDKTEECHNKANARIATAGNAVLGVGALLLFGMFAYVMPKAADKPEEEEEPEPEE